MGQGDYRDPIDRLLSGLAKRGLLPFPVTDNVAETADSDAAASDPQASRHAAEVLRRTRVKRIFKELGVPHVAVRAWLSARDAECIEDSNRDLLKPVLLGRVNADGELCDSEADRSGYALLQEPSGDALTCLLRLSENTAVEPLIPGDVVLVASHVPDRSTLLVVAGPDRAVHLSQTSRGLSEHLEALHIFGDVIGWTESPPSSLG